MINFGNLGNYRENNRIEAKKALGGFPHSVWETYSAFANTYGGVILLGVEEHSDRSLHAVDLPAPEELVKVFWETVNDKNKVSANILSPRNVRIRKVEGKRIIVIKVPRARRFERPVYIGTDPMTGSYRRNGEGDYRCTEEEVRSMLRDASKQSQDAVVLVEETLDVLDRESVCKFRSDMADPFGEWEKLDENEFLCRIGAAAVSEGLHPTAAGLLMFGFEQEIKKKFPNYLLAYRDAKENKEIVSDSGDWNGNVYNFYLRVSEDLSQKIERMSGFRANHLLAKSALREALVNCLVNADYYGRSGVSIVRDKEKITFSNPGNFRFEISAAHDGGLSDPRNTNLIKMFQIIGVSECRGSGIPEIFDAWHKLGLPSPSFKEQLEPGRITLTLSTKKESWGRERGTRALKSHITKYRIIRYLTDHAFAGSAEIADLLDVTRSSARDILTKMTADGVLITEMRGRTRVYLLKH